MNRGIYEWCALVVDLIFLSLLHLAVCILSLGLLTGTASVALYRVCFLRIAQEDRGVFRDYFRAIRENFRQSLPLNLLLVAVIYILWFYLSNGLSGELLGFFLSGSRVVLLAAGFFVISALLYLIPLLAYFHTTFLRAMVSAFALSMNYLLVTVLLYAVFAAMLLLIHLTGGFAFLFLTGGYSYVSARILKKVFDRHRPKEEEN